MRYRFAVLALAILAALLLSSPAFAQIYGRRPQKVQAAEPKPPYDPRDLSGVWWGRGVSLLMGGAQPAFTPLGQKLFDADKPSFGPRAVLPVLGNDPQGRCSPLGYPRSVYANNRPFDFVQTPLKIVQIFEWTHGTREIWLDGRKIPEDLDPRWFGYAVGHWEGNTLIVHSAGYNDKTWLDQVGNPHDENMTVDERISHPDVMTLLDTMTLTDSTVYTAPLVSAKPQVFQLQLPKGPTELEEEYCVPDEENFFNEHDRDPAGGVIHK